MQILRLALPCVVCVSLLVSGCVQPKSPAGSQAVSKIEAGPDAHKRAQTALIKAKPGDTIEFGEGKFEFTSTLSLDVSDVTIRGQGEGKFQAQLHGRTPLRWAGEVRQR